MPLQVEQLVDVHAVRERNLGGDRRRCRKPLTPQGGGGPRERVRPAWSCRARSSRVFRATRGCSRAPARCSAASLRRSKLAELVFEGRKPTLCRSEYSRPRSRSARGAVKLGQIRLKLDRSGDLLECVVGSMLPPVDVGQSAEGLEATVVQADGRFEVGGGGGEVSTFKPNDPAIDEQRVVEIGISSGVAQELESLSIIGVG